MKVAKKRQMDVAFVLVWPILASLLSFLFDVNVLGATLFFLIIPGVYLSFRNPKCVARAALFSLISLPALFSVEYFAIKNGAWFFNANELILPDFFNTVAFEAVIWYFAWFFLVIMYYEHFLDKDAHTKLGGPRLKYMLFAFMGCLVFTLVIAINNLPHYVPYYYLVFCLLLILTPIVLVLHYNPSLFTKFAKVTLYFTYLHFVMDFTHIKLGHWSYPGEFIGWFQIFGAALPAEELIFWVVLSAAAIVSWYYYFDEKN